MRKPSGREAQQRKQVSLTTKLRGLKEVWAFDNRLWLTVTKSLFCREQLHVYRYKGMDILVDHASGDANGAREVLTSPMYSRFFDKMQLSGPLNLLDIGGSNGGFPLLFAANGFDLQKVVSVELNPRTHTRLHFNLHRNLDCEVIVINAAVCGESRTIKLRLGPGGVSDSILAETEPDNGREYEIQGMTFDDLYSTYFDQKLVDVCKIDVEGAEFEILLSPDHRSLAKCRYLMIEIHEGDGRKAMEILPILEGLSFEMTPHERGADPSVYLFRNTNLDRSK